MVTVLFVCLGNICRSPMRSDFSSESPTSRFRIDYSSVSAATSHWEVGSQPHKEPEKFWSNKEFPIMNAATKSSQVILKI